MDLIKLLHRQKVFSEKTFGPGQRTLSVINHIKKELMEIEENPNDIFEWIDVIALAFDGARRMGHTPEELAQALVDKQTIVENRKWPDWKTLSDGEPICHIKD